MSAFICSDRTINWIVAGLNNRFYREHLRIPEVLKDMTQEEMGNAIFDLNLAGVEARYDDDGGGLTVTETGVERAYKYQCTGSPRKVQFLSSLRCLLYQCAEGDIPETNELYKQLDYYSLELAYDIVRDTDEYQNAKWD